MKTIILTLIIALTSVFGISCTKEKNANRVAPFDATGFWQGNFPIDPHAIVAIFNRQDGSSRYYLMGQFHDTANAFVKYDGKFKVTGDFFQASYRFDSTGFKDSILLQTLTTSPTAMTGIMIQQTRTTADSGEGIFNFNLIKQ